MEKFVNRRSFMKMSGAFSACAGVASRMNAVAAALRPVRSAAPSYLEDYQQSFSIDPHAAALEWFRDARFGLFLHYGLYSILGRGEWVMLQERIPVSEYEKLKMEFNPHRFDADFITDLACEAGMKYVNITTRHHDSFCLFDSKYSDYNSVQSPAGRDLVGELAIQCQKKKLGLFFYYSYALDWWHPWFFPRKYFRAARPPYEHPEPRYLWRQDDDFVHYINFVHGQIKELLTNYGPVAGMWFDPIMSYYARPDLFPIEETYNLIRSLQPQALISFKQGATGTEDFAAPEREGYSMAEAVFQRFECEERASIAASAWDANKKKHNEICDTLQPLWWGYNKEDADNYLDTGDVLNRLARAFGANANLLLNTGPRADGSIRDVDISTLKDTGYHIRTEGWPDPIHEPNQEKRKEIAPIA